MLVYVRNSFSCEQVESLEDDLFQSVWLKGGLKNKRQILFSHAYREHTSTLGSSIRAQKESLGTFLAQWEMASNLGLNEPMEVHVCGDMNLDSWKNKWLSPSYALRSLSSLVQEACSVNNFTQLVSIPTRYQYDSVRKAMDISCIDHVYCNMKFRCSDVSVIPFGNSDHDIVSYVRFSKEPPEPAKTIIKRSYKSFDDDKFLSDLRAVDWLPVFLSKDVDSAVDLFTSLFSSVLDVHAPWVKFQKRKNHAPWITEETKELIRKRDEWKRISMDIAQQGGDSTCHSLTQAWSQYKKFRN